MKKILLFAAISVATVAVAQNQTDKGWSSVGGTGNLHFDLDGSDGTNNYFQLGPELYWFAGNSFGIGTDFGFSASMFFQEIGDSIRYNNNALSAWVTPGFRYYFRDPEKAWRPYAFLNAGYQITSSKSKGVFDNNTSLNYNNKTTTSGFRGYTGMGMAWFFSEHAAFDIRLRVLDLYPGRDSNGNAEMQVGYNPDFSIGVQAFFD